MIPLHFEVFAVKPDFFARCIAWGLNSLIVGLLLKFLGVMKVLLTSHHQTLELGG